MAKKAATAPRPRKPKFIVQLAIRRDHFAKIAADKQIALFAAATELSNPRSNVVVLIFERKSWFYLCGETFALALLNVPFQLHGVSVEVSKGGAK